MNNKREQGGYRRLTADDIELGQPLRWSVHDDQGHLLLAKGAVVRTENQRSRLVDQRVFVSLSPREAARQRSARADQERDQNRVYRQRAVDVFSWLDAHFPLLAHSYELLAQGPSSDAVANIRRLAVALQRAAEQHQNGLLAAIYLSGDERPYSHVKALHVALLCNELGRVQNFKMESRLSLIAAGLTHDVAFWELQDEIRLREAPLSDDQWQIIRGHCASGAALLRQSGVQDPVWLAAVEQHHERLNGSGYHAGLKEAQIEPYARILAIADVFAAMVRTRADRGKLMPKDAMREIFMTRGEEIDGTLVQLFIKKLGMFPPGCLLRLVTGEIGVATGPGVSAASPDVEVIVDALGQPLARPLYRDTNSKGYAVKELVGEVEHPKLHDILASLWDPVPLTL